MGNETSKATGMIVSGVLASEAFDSSGESISIKGMDISILEEGRGVLNYEHQESENDPTKKDEPHGEEIVGRILFAKKIYSEDDCSDDDQRKFWKITKLPFLYGICRLYDGAGHEGAKALAASIRDAVANEDPIILGFSIEGTTLEKQGNVLKSTLARMAAITTKPCNKQSLSSILLDPHAPEGFSKNPSNVKTHYKTEDPSKIRLGGSEIEYSVEMLKTITAGSYNSAPGTLTGGAALQVEDKTLKSMAQAARRDWDKTGKFKDYLKSYLDKAELGDVSDEFLNHYSDLVETQHFRIKKSEEVISELKVAGKTPKIPKTSLPKVPKPELLTNNGEEVKPNKKITEPKFDDVKGVLHMPQGSFKVYIPGKDTPEMASKFHEILNDPKVEAIHNYAMENWSKAHQLLKAGQLPPEVAMHAVLFSNLSPNCLDAETEALTQRGWIKGFDLKITDQILTKNAENGHLEWQAPTDLRLFPDYEGPMVEFKSRSFYALTTPDHEWLVTTGRGHQRIKKSCEITFHSDKIHRTGEYYGPEVSGLSGDEAELLGWFVTDGHYQKSIDYKAGRSGKYETKYETSGIYAYLTQSYQGNPEKCQRIDELVARLGDETTRRDDTSKNSYTWRLGPKLTKMLLERSPERCLTVRSLLDLDRTALDRLREAMVLGDGNVWQGGEDWALKEQLTTGRQEQAEAFQILLTLTGNAGSIKWRDMSMYKPKSDKMKNVPKMTGCYNVTVLQRQFVSISPEHRTDIPKMKVGVWCPILPNHFFVARRRGHVFITKNTPVPMQERMYGSLVDSMKATGETPLTPGWQNIKQDWLDRDQPQKFPDHSPEHWKRLESSLRLKHDSKTTGRMKGDIGSFMLANDKFVNMSKYKDMHSKLQDLLQRHKGDTRSAVEEMMYHKNEQTKWNNRRRIGAGKEDIGDYPGMSIAGLAPKTARYALGMMGGGNVHVPDTHFTRNLFGLNRQKDGSSIDAIKNVMWEPRNSHILNGIDRYYAKNHDAVQHMVNHPKWGHLFKDNPEDAVFPAFWKHWMAIVPHEQARGHTVSGYNELTDHKPFWEAIAPYMKKSESTDSIPMQTAKQHAEWQLQYGEMPAMMLYYRHLLPQLLASAAGRQAGALIRKAQSVGIEVLAKGFTPRTQAKLESLGGFNPNPKTVTFQNRQILPGKAFLHHQHGADAFHLVGQSPTHLFGIKETDEKSIHDGWGPDDVHKIPRDSKDLEVQSYPETKDEPLVVNADVHGVHGFVNHPESRKLAHGFDFGGKTSKATGGAFSNDSFWSKDPSGGHVYVKAASNVFGDTTEGPWNTARREGAYHNIAKDFFGLGAYLPAVAVVRHPATGKEHAIIQHIPGAHEHELSDNQKINALSKMNKNGDLHKVAAMNFILNNNDRHAGNYLYSGKNKHDKITLIDHNMFGIYNSTKWKEPSYLSWANDDKHPDIDIMKPMHPEAQRWLQSLDEGELRNHLMKNGMPQKGIDISVDRLRNLKKEAPVRPFHTAMKASLPDFEGQLEQAKQAKPFSSADSQSQSVTSEPKEPKKA